MDNNYLKLAVHDPAVIGPGYWVSWHRKALKAHTKEDKTEVARSIAKDIVNFPCNHCREHAVRYSDKHKFLPVINDDNIYSLFYWTVDFHNTVNKFLNKLQIPREEALLMWADSNVCKEGDCSDNKGEKQEDKKRFRDLLK